MKKFFKAALVLLICAAGLAFAEEPSETEKQYNDFLTKAKDFVNQEKYVHAADCYWQAMEVNPKGSTEAYNSFMLLMGNFEKGKPGLSKSYDPFTLYDGYVNLLKEFEDWAAENPDKIFSLVPVVLDKGSLDMKARTVQYDLHCVVDYSYEFDLILYNIAVGLYQKWTEDWVDIPHGWPLLSIYNNQNKDFNIAFHSLSDKLPAKPMFGEEIKAIKPKPYYQGNGSYGRGIYGDFYPTSESKVWYMPCWTIEAQALSDKADSNLIANNFEDAYPEKFRTFPVDIDYTIVRSDTKKDVAVSKENLPAKKMSWNYKGRGTVERGIHFTAAGADMSALDAGNYEIVIKKATLKSFDVNQKILVANPNDRSYGYHDISRFDGSTFDLKVTTTTIKEVPVKIAINEKNILKYCEAVSYFIKHVNEISPFKLNKENGNYETSISFTKTGENSYAFDGELSLEDAIELMKEMNAGSEINYKVKYPSLNCEIGKGNILVFTRTQSTAEKEAEKAAEETAKAAAQAEAEKQEKLRFEEKKTKYPFQNANNFEVSIVTDEGATISASNVEQDDQFALRIEGNTGIPKTKYGWYELMSTNQEILDQLSKGTTLTFTVLGDGSTYGFSLFIGETSFSYKFSTKKGKESVVTIPLKKLTYDPWTPSAKFDASKITKYRLRWENPSDFAPKNKNFGITITNAVIK